MKKIIFSEKDHRYVQGDSVYTSVTRLIKKYQKPFNKKHWSKYKAIERLMDEENFAKIKSKARKDKIFPSSPAFIEYMMKFVDYGQFVETTETILDEWAKKNLESTRKGNLYHKVREEKSYKDGEELNLFDNKKYPTFAKEKLVDADNYSLIEDLYELDPGYYPELLIWNEDACVAGQADKIFIGIDDNGEKWVDVDDYKTNNKIDTENKWNKLLGPLSHLDDCKFNVYSMQISMYAWMMEQFGFKVRNLAFHHFNQKYEVEYLKDECATIIDAHIKANRHDF